MKKRSPLKSILKWIIIYVVELIVAAGLITLGAMLDTNMADPNALGHPVPVFTVLLTLVAVGIVVISILVMFVKLLKFIFQSGKREDV